MLSHWALDLVVHRPDLPLYGDVLKVGLGLWDYPAVALGLEVGLLFGGLYLYLRATRPVSSGARYGLPLFCLLLVGVQILAFFGPPPPSDKAGAATGLTFYLAFAGIAAWLERKRT